MELKQLALFLWRWSWLMILCGGLAGAAAFVVSEQQPATYTATTTLLLNPGNPTREGLDLGGQQEQAYVVQTYMALLQQRPIFEGVVANLGLPMSAGTLATKVSVSLVEGTQLIEVSVEDADPQRAAAIANEIIMVFTQQESALIANPYATNRPGLHIVETALPPSSSNQTSALMIVVLAAGVGVVLGAGTGFLLEYLDSSIRSSQHIEQFEGLMTMAVIKRIKGGSPFEKLVTLKKPFSSTAESYRMIRAHIEFAEVEQPIRSIVITSSGNGEGKSVTAANMAVALAQTGIRVILVDTNLRKPALHTFFQQENRGGFTTAIAQQGQNHAKNHLLSSGVDNLRLLLSGPLPSEPASGLLARQHIETLIDELKSEADIILFDSPSLLDFIDTTLIMQATDAAVLVVRARKTQTETLTRAWYYLVRSRTHLLGALLNEATAAEYQYAYSTQKIRRDNVGIPKTVSG